LPHVQEIYSIQKINGVKHFSEFLELGKNDNPEILKPYRDAVQSTDIATIVYTSGTTGVPKGVMLSHHNVVSNIVTSVKLLPVNSTMKALSFLPLNHIFERMVFFVYMYVGVSIYYAESLDTIRDNLQEVKPHFFTTVPRLLEKVYDKIVLTGTGLKGIKKALFFWALNLGLKYDFEKENDFFYMAQLGIARKLVFSKWKQALGGNIVAIVSGASALQERLSRVFWGAGIPVLEGYGQTETSPVVSVGTLEPIKGFRFGTVGKPIEGVEVKILQEPGYREGEGEILVKGPNVMQGYYKNPDATKETIEPDGWLHTGDIGMIIDGFIKITDRKKELFKTSGGKYIAPQKVENFIKSSLYIEQVMVVGAEKKFPAALIVPTFANLQEWCKLHNITVNSNEEMIKHPKVIQKIQEEVDKANESLAQFEKVKKFVLLPKEWTVESGELTPSMKMKRRVITENYKDLIESLYIE
jgi:long-chain acyl-CoA synthetase